MPGEDGADQRVRAWEGGAAAPLPAVALTAWRDSRSVAALRSGSTRTCKPVERAAANLVKQLGARA
jgi:hypothetical protein